MNNFTGDMYNIIHVREQSEVIVNSALILFEHHESPVVF